MINYLKKIAKVLNNSKIVFSNPKKTNLIVFDDYSLRDLENVLKNRDYFTMISRAYRIKELYISFSIIINIFKNLKRNLFTSYLIALLKVIRPKAVITTMDNSFKFHEIAKYLESEQIKFIGIQNAARYDFKELDFAFKNKSIIYNPLNNFYVPYYFCFSSEEENEIKSRGYYVKKFFKNGSIRLSNYLHYLKTNNIEIRKNYYDISVLSGYSVDKDSYFKINGMDKKWAINVKFAINFSIENNLKFIFIGKKPKGKSNEVELAFFKKYLTNNEYIYLIENSTIVDKKNFSSYKAIHESNVVTGFVSTMLRDKLALNGKILACNFTDYDMWDFPIKKFCFLKKPSYETYSERLKLIHSLENKKFFELIDDYKLINNNKENLTFDCINDFLNQTFKV